MPAKINYAKLYTLRSDGRYQGAYYDERGNRHFVTARDPKEVYLKIQEKTSPKVRTFADACDAWEERRRSEVTVRTWNNYAPHLKDLKRNYGKTPITSITSSMIAVDLERMKDRQYSRTVVNSRRVIWSGVLRNEVLLGNLQFNSADSVKLPKNLSAGKRCAPTNEQIKLILANADAPFGFFPFLLLCTGLRKSEALALEWNDINLDKRVISVTKSLEYVSTTPRVKSPKSEAGNRLVPIIDCLYDELAKRKPANGNSLLFPAPRSNRGGAGGGYMTERGYEGAWDSYCAAVGLTDITAHNLRHGTATLLFESGVDVEAAQHILGHSRVTTTLDIYVDLRNEHLMKNADRFSAAMSNLMQE